MAVMFSYLISVLIGFLFFSPTVGMFEFFSFFAFNEHLKGRIGYNVFWKSFIFIEKRGLQKGPKESSTLSVILFLFADAKTGEFLQLKIFNENYRVSDSEMHEMIKEANLTGHGYKKEVTIKQKQNADTGKLEHEVFIANFHVFVVRMWRGEPYQKLCTFEFIRKIVREFQKLSILYFFI